MTAPLEDRRGSEVGDRPASTPHDSRGRRRHREPTAKQSLPSPSHDETLTPARRCRLVPFSVTAEGIVDLPDGAVVVALDFIDDGGFGYRRRPATAWATVVIEDSTDT
jgi:hypothetical protein